MSYASRGRGEVVEEKKSRVVFSAGVLVIGCLFSFVAGMQVALLLLDVARGSEHDAVTVFAHEVCLPGKDPISERGCIAWVESCMWSAMTRAERYDWDDAGENCIETLPQEFWPI